MWGVCEKGKEEKVLHGTSISRIYHFSRCYQNVTSLNDKPWI